MATTQLNQGVKQVNFPKGEVLADLLNRATREYSALGEYEGLFANERFQQFLNAARVVAKLMRIFSPLDVDVEEANLKTLIGTSLTLGYAIRLVEEENIVDMQTPTPQEAEPHYFTDAEERPDEETSVYDNPCGD